MYTVNSECGLMSIKEANVEAAKAVYEKEMHYDFDGAADYPGSWYFIECDGVRVEEMIDEMP